MVSRLFCGAAGQIRTADLILTKDALYRLSYSSKWRPGRGSNPRPPAWQAGVLTSWTTWPFTGIHLTNEIHYNIYKRTCKVFFNGRGRKTRTLDTRFWRPLLYQLSYTPMWWAFGDSNPGPTGYEPAALTNWAKGPSDCLSLIFKKERVPPPEWRHSWLPLLDSNQRHRG